jgi:hypothetical protein
MTNVEALKALYAALGGDAADVADATTITAVLNAIAAKYEGADDATTNAEAIANITAVLDNIIPEPTPTTLNAEYIASPTFAVQKSNLKHIDVPSGVTAIGNSAFYEATNLETVTLPDTLISIDTSAFSGCKKLKMITIPSSVHSINNTAFSSCTALETITINKPEGSITGAPWDAPNATVVWKG